MGKTGPQISEFRRKVCLPVVSNHDSIRDPEDPQGFPATVVVEDILVGLVELADDVEDTLGDLGDEGPHNSAVSEVEDVEATSRWCVDAVTPVLRTRATPLR
jgi:hypothetical protein